MGAGPGSICPLLRSSQTDVGVSILLANAKSPGQRHGVSLSDVMSSSYMTVW